MDQEEIKKIEIIASEDLIKEIYEAVELLDYNSYPDYPQNFPNLKEVFDKILTPKKD